jgi:outer membrane translocation and assembly module TamA
VHNRERYTIAPETLLDLTLRDDLIALGLDPTGRTLRGGGLLAAVEFDAQRNTTGNILDAKRGYVAALHVEHAGRFLPGAFNYREVTLEGRHYLTIADRVVLANRAKIGAINGPDPIGQHVPFFKRYFLGGSSSLRGWGRFEVAPLSGSGLPLGGHSMLELSSEVRVPIWGNLGGVVFVDAGNAWDDPWRFRLGDLRIDAGPGLRYLTPIGPIRFDVGFQLNPIDGLLVDGKPQRWPLRIHFSIGQAF